LGVSPSRVALPAARQPHPMWQRRGGTGITHTRATREERLSQCSGCRCQTAAAWALPRPNWQRNGHPGQHDRGMRLPRRAGNAPRLFASSCSTSTRPQRSHRQPVPRAQGPSREPCVKAEPPPHPPHRGERPRKSPQAMRGLAFFDPQTTMRT
jgi:hypothetical protein